MKLIEEPQKMTLEGSIDTSPLSFGVGAAIAASVVFYRAAAHGARRNNIFLIVGFFAIVLGMLLLRIRKHNITIDTANSTLTFTSRGIFGVFPKTRVESIDNIQSLETEFYDSSRPFLFSIITIFVLKESSNIRFHFALKDGSTISFLTYQSRRDEEQDVIAPKIARFIGVPFKKRLVDVQNL